MARSLFERMLTHGHLRRAWRRVRANHGVPGQDGVTLDQFARHLDANLRVLADEVRAGMYQPGPLLRVQIRASGKVRSLDVPPVRDRIVQRAALDILTPICDPRFSPSSFAYRPGRGVQDAVAQVVRYRDRGHVAVVYADITDCFGSLDHALMRRFIAEFVPDPRIRNLLVIWTMRGAAAGRRGRCRGIPLGSIVSPFLCNVYLHHLDTAMQARDIALVRYADDFVLLCPTHGQAARALRVTTATLRDLRLDLNQRKTRLTSFEEGFDFLGVHFERNTYLYLPAAVDLPGVEGAPVEAPLSVPARRFGWLRRSGSGRTIE